MAAAAASFGITSAASGRATSSGTTSKRSSADGNVHEYGAKGDGKADDTRAVQSAIDSGSGSVYFPKGVYRITKTIEIDLDKVGYTSVRSEGAAEIVMEGAGPAFKFTGTHFKSANPKDFADEVWRRQRMPIVDNIAILGAHPEAVGIEAVGTMQLTVSRLHVRKALHAIHLKGQNRNVIVSDSHLYDNRGVGIYYDNVDLHQSNITGCHISYNTGGGIVSRGGNVRNIQIAGCDIESNMGKDTPSTANIFIDGSTSALGTAEVAITGCTVQHNSDSPESANIRIFGSSESGTSATRKRWGNVTITGNVLSDVMVNLHLKGCRGVAISGNTFWKGFRHNILLEGCSGIAMGANVFDANSAYASAKGAKNSLRVLNCEDCTFTGLQLKDVEDRAGLSIEDSRRINISHCTILDCDHAGLSLKNVVDSIVSGCLIRNDRQPSGFTPIEKTGGKGNLIDNNLLS